MTGFAWFTIYHLNFICNEAENRINIYCSCLDEAKETLRTINKIRIASNYAVKDKLLISLDDYKLIMDYSKYERKETE